MALFLGHFLCQGLQVAGRQILNSGDGVFCLL